MAGRARQGKWLYLVLALVLSLAAACGNGGTDDTAQPPPAPDNGVDDGEPDDDATPDTAARRMTVATPGVVSSLDSERYQGFISIDLLPNIAGTLLSFQRPEAGTERLPTPESLEGELAESWEANDDGTVVTFTLREDARSPFGNTVTSADVEWSFQRMIESEGVPIARILMGIGGYDMENTIEVVDDRTFRLNIERPNAVSLSVLSTFFMTIYDTEEVLQHATDDDPFAYEWLSENTATFGPYHLNSFDPGREVQLVANPNYWAGQPDITEVLIRAVPEGSNRVQLIERGEVDIAMGFTFTEVQSLDASPNAVVERVLYPNIDDFAMNVTVEPFDDPRVRRALSLAVDRDAILQSSYLGFGTPAEDFFHNDFGAPAVAEPIQRDLDEARRLLAEAGAEGLEFEFAYNVANLGPHSEQTAVAIEAQLADIGVTARGTNIPSGADFDAAKRDGSLAAWLETSLPLVPDPGYYLQVFYVTGGLTNQKQYSNEELDRLSREIMETQPGSARDQLIVEVNELMIADMPSVPLVDAQKFYAFAPDLAGFRSYPQGHIHYFDLTFE
jgi:peptide/nickel transport system substrate-binding protein